MPAPKFKTPINNAEDVPTIEFFDCDYEQERHAIVMVTDCDLFGGIKASTKYDRAVKPAIQLIAQPNANLDMVANCIVTAIKPVVQLVNPGLDTLSCLVAFVNSASP